MESQFTTKRTCSSHAKTNHSLLEYVTTMDGIGFHWCNVGDNGNHDIHQRKHATHYVRQTVSTTYLPRSKKLNGFTQFVDIQSNPHGYEPSKRATTLYLHKHI